MPLPSLARPALGIALLDIVLAAAVTPGTGGVPGAFLDQGRVVPWGGVLTVAAGWAQALLT